MKFSQILIKYEDLTDQEYEPEKIDNLYQLMCIMEHKKGNIINPKNLYEKLRAQKDSKKIIEDTKIKVVFLIKILNDLIRITNVESIKSYWQDVAKTVIDHSILGMILTKEEGDHLYQTINKEK